MLFGSTGIPEPAVVRNVDEHLRTLRGEFTYLVGKHRFVADEHTELVAVNRQRHTFVAEREVAYFTCEFPSKAKEVLERNVLPEWHQVNFVITSKRPPLRSHYRCRVVDLAVVCGWSQSNLACNHIRVRIDCNLIH